MRELDAAHNKLESNLKKAKGLDKLKTDADKAGKASQSTTRNLNTLSTSTTKFDRDAEKASRSVKHWTGEMAGAQRASSGLMNSLRQGVNIGGSGGMFGGGILPGLANISNIIQGIPQIGQLAGAIINPLKEGAEEGVKLNMTLEQADIAFTNVAGSAEKAHEHVMKVLGMGAASPFRFEGLLAGVRLMNTFGFDLDEQLPKLRIWGDAIASGGEITSESVRSVITAFGQMRMAGRVNAQDMMQLTNANIPGWQLLAKAIGKTVAETRKLSEAGKLNGKVAVEAITAMMAIDPRFQGMMDKLQKSTAGRISAFQDMVQIAQGTATKGLTENLSKTLQDVLDGPDVVGKTAAGINAALTPISGLMELGIKSVLAPGMTKGFVEGLQNAAPGVKGAVSGFIIDNVLSTAKGVLGINSPSTVFIGYGLDSASGYGIGFRFGMTGAGREILTALNQTLDKVEGVIQSRSKRVFSSDIEKLIKENAAKFNVPEDLIRAVIEQESSGRAGAISPKGAVGLMQLMPATAKRFGVKNRKDPAESISGGTQYLKFLMDLFGPNNLELVLAGYNAGEGAVQKYGNKVPPYAETQNYVQKIMSRLRQNSTTNVASTLGANWLNNPTMMGQTYQGILDLLTPQDLEEQKKLGETIKATMERLATVNRDLTDAQKILDNSRPGTPNYSMTGEYAASFRVDNLKAEADKLTKTLSSLNLAMQQNLQSTISLRLAEKASLDQYRSTLDLSGNVFSEKELLTTTSIDPSTLTLNLRPLKPLLVESAEAMKTLGTESTRAAGPLVVVLENLKKAYTDKDAAGIAKWTAGLKKLMSSMGSVTERLSGFFDSLPTTKQLMEGVFLDIPSRFGDIMGNAVQNADGTLKGFWKQVKADAIQTIRDIAGEITRQLTTRIMTQFFMSALGTAERDVNGEPTGRNVGGWLPGLMGSIPLLGKLFNKPSGSTGGSGSLLAGALGSSLPKRAFGGSVIGGISYVVGDHPSGRPNPEIFTPSRDGYITPVSAAVREALGSMNVEGGSREPNTYILALGDKQFREAMEEHGSTPYGKRARVMQFKRDKKALYRR